MKLIVGLGNPGEEYAKTRHNVGFMVVDALASKVNGGRWTVSRKLHSTLFAVHQTLVLAKPETFMNNSGKTVKKIINQYGVKTPDVWVVHDDLDLHLGNYKVQKGKGPREHKGVSSVEEKLGKDFWRVRIGVDNRDPENRIQGEDYVLQNFSDRELAIVNEVIGKIVENLNQNAFN